MPEAASPTGPRGKGGLTINITARGEGQHSHLTRGSPTRSNASPTRNRLGERLDTRDDFLANSAVPGTAKLRFMDMKDQQPVSEELEYLDQTISSSDCTCS